MSIEYPICMRCHEVYSLEILKLPLLHDNHRCPKIGCGSKIVLVDENMIEIFKILNKKGYTTEYCCSSHMWDKYPKPYVSFADGVMISQIHIPEGFQLEKSFKFSGGQGPSKYILRAIKTDEILDGEGFQRSLFTLLNNLLHWALSLAPYEENLKAPEPTSEILVRNPITNKERDRCVDQ